MHDARLGALEPFNDFEAIDLNAARALIRPERGDRLNLQLLQRWVCRGWKPRRSGIPPLKFPAVRWGVRYLTMPSWLDAWKAARARLGSQLLTPATRPGRPQFAHRTGAAISARNGRPA
jgi:hypothetical protein